jgi:hypothetical protein
MASDPIGRARLHARRARTVSRQARNLAVSLALSAVAPAAAAQVSPSDRETARALMEQGDARAAVRDYLAALKLYQAASALVPVPSIGFEVAKTRVALGQLIAARESALAVTRIPRAADEPAVFTQARSRAAALATALAPRIPSIVIALSNLPPGSVPVVRVDGEVIPPESLALPRKVDPGTHALLAHVDGLDDVAQRVTTTEGVELAVTLSFHGATTRAGAGTGRAPGPESPSSRRWVVPYVAVGVGGAGGALVVTGAITGALSLAQASTARTYCTGDVCQSPAQAHIDASRRLAWASDVTLGLGVVGLAVGALLAFTAPRRRAPAIVAALGALPALSLGPSSAVTSWTWHFR